VKRLRVRIADDALNDILEQADWYKQQSGQTLARRWENAVTTAILGILKNPHCGALCSFSAEGLDSIWRMPISKFPKHLIFYRLENRQILILRVVHGARDLESLF
jgi:toxin ParE1/3/4